jgi:triacylglycerol lipase
MTDYLTTLGWRVHSFNFTPNSGKCGLEILAQQVTDYVNRAFPPEQLFDLVGFSMGGLIGRYYLQCLGGANRVQRFISISSPHSGTWAAYLLSHLGGRQMRPRSTFLQKLNHKVEVLASINCTSIWTPLDLAVMPANNSLLAVGRQVKIAVVWHDWMPNDKRVLKAVVDGLTSST